MARARSENGNGRRPPATTAEERELELASKAYDLAEEQIGSGTVSSQVLTHFLKMGSTRERLEQQRMEHEIQLMEVKREQIQSQKHIEELFVDAINAMRTYKGGDPAELDRGE